MRMVCLHTTEIGSIDFSILVADCHRFSTLRDVCNSQFITHNSQLFSWLRSFRLAWGLGGKLVQAERNGKFI